MLNLKFTKSNLIRKNLYSEENYFLNLPKNLREKDRSIFYDIQKRKAKQVDVHIFKDAFLVFDAIILNFFIWDELTHALRLKISAKLKRLFFLFTRKTVKIDKGVWIIDNWSNNFFHWTSEALPRLISCTEYIDSHPVLLPSEYKGIKFVEESLSILGFVPFYYDRKINYQIKEIITVNKAGYVIDFQKEAILKLRRIFWLKYSTKKPFRKVYISRENATHRKVLNEVDVIEKLKQHDFEIVYFEFLSIKDQIKLMMETTIIAGLHGAGLVNMLYMPSGSKVLEFRNEGDSWVLSQSFYSLASILGHDYFYTDNQANSIKTGFADFQIDLNKLEQALIHLGS